MVVEVPYRQLSPEALKGLIEEFVTRDGTDYGDREASLERKVEDVARQLERGEAVVLFDTERAAAHIALADPRRRG